MSHHVSWGRPGYLCVSTTLDLPNWQIIAPYMLIPIS